MNENTINFLNNIDFENTDNVYHIVETLYEENKKYKEVIDKAIEYISELDDNTDDTTCYDIDKYTRDYILSILKEVE